MKILVVDDDPELLPLISFALRQAGFLPIEAASGEEALRRDQDEQCDLVVLDVNLPGIDGFETCRRLRAGRPRLPILMLSVRGSELDQVQGLDLGADDYLTKPFSPRHLLARIRALLRRADQPVSGALARPSHLGTLRLDPALESLQLGDQPPLRLTPLEFRLMQVLFLHAGRTLPAERLIQHIWGSRDSGDRQALKQLVHRLRQKLEAVSEAPRFLVTEPGLGYRLDIPDPR
jgi:DNA-binding response OmpR family regulator